MEIKFNNVCKTIGTKKILNNVSFSIPPGSVFALIGPNGAGKTTIGRILLNTYEVSSGNVTVDGVNVSDIHFHLLTLILLVRVSSLL